MRFLLLCGTALMLAGPALADPFGFQVTIDGRTDSRSYRSAEDTLDALKSNGLRQINPNYTDTSAANANIQFRGVPALASYAAGSSVLRFAVPGAGIDREFAGATRDESAELLRRYFEGREGGAEITRILRLAVRTTAADPIAGNPASAMNQAVARDFDAILGAGGPSNAASLGVRFGSFSGAGFRTRTLDLPIGLSWSLSDRDTLEVDAPLSMADTEGATSYGGNIGVRYRRRVTDNWTLQPSLRVGGAGSVDLGSGSGIYSAALNSSYRIKVNPEWGLNIVNGLTYVSTFPVHVGAYQLDYDLSNVVFRNGVAVSYDAGIQVMGRATTISVFAVDTRFTGDAVYISNYQEFGIYATVGTTAPLRLGLTGLVGEHGARGFYINTGLSF